MSKKRSANNELNHDNWDQEEEVEEAGKFTVASKEQISERKIKVAKRRHVGEAPVRHLKAAFYSHDDDKGGKNAEWPLAIRAPAAGLFSSFTGFDAAPTAPMTSSNAFAMSKFSSSTVTNTPKNNETPTMPIGTKNLFGNANQTPAQSNDNVNGAASPPRMTAGISVSNTTNTNTKANPSPFSAFSMGAAGAVRSGGTPFSSTPKQSTTIKNVSAATAAKSEHTGAKRVRTDQDYEKKRQVYLEAVKELNEGVLAFAAEHVKGDPYVDLAPVFSDYFKHFSSLEQKHGFQRAESKKHAKHHHQQQHNGKSPVKTDAIPPFVHTIGDSPVKTETQKPNPKKPTPKYDFDSTANPNYNFTGKSEPTKNAGGGGLPTHGTGSNNNDIFKFTASKPAADKSEKEPLFGMLNQTKQSKVKLETTAAASSVDNKNGLFSFGQSNKSNESETAPKLVGTSLFSFGASKSNEESTKDGQFTKSGFPAFAMKKTTESDGGGAESTNGTKTEATVSSTPVFSFGQSNAPAPISKQKVADAAGPDTKSTSFSFGFLNNKTSSAAEVSGDSKTATQTTTPFSFGANLAATAG